MRRPDPGTLQSLIEGLPAFGRRRAVGLREDLGLRWWTYAKLHRAAHRAAALLGHAGIGKGDCVVLRAANSPEWTAFFLGAMLRGATVAPIDHDAPPELIERIVSTVDAKAFVSDRGGSDQIPFVDMHSLALDRPAPREDVVVPVTPADPAIVFFTSGTTSQPRGVVLTHANLVAQLAGFRRWRFLARPVAWRMLVMAPLSHAQGLVVGVVLPLSFGLSVVYTHSSNPGHLIRLLRDNRVALFSTLPRVLHVLRQAFLSQRYGKGRETLGEKLARTRTWALRRHYVFTHMRRVVGYKGLWVVMVGGAPLPEADEEFWRVSGCLVVQGYGLTETAAIVSVNAPVMGRFGSVGKAPADTEVRIADDGEILVRGAMVSARYLGGTPAATTADGFLHTGDVGRLDDQNRLFVVGRKKDVVVTGEGFNVHSRDVEAVLTAQPGVEDAVVLGGAGNGHTEVHAVLLLRRGGDAAAIVARTNERLLPYERIASWTVWPEPDFPRSALMKPKRQQIADAIAGPDRSEKPPPRPERERLVDVLSIADRHDRIAALARFIASGSGECPDGASLSLIHEAGLGSLDLIELLALLEKHSGRSLDRLPIDRDVTVGELQTLVNNPRETALRPFYARDAHRWAELPLLSALRRAINPAVLDTVVRMRARLSTSGVENLAGLELPAIFAGGGHEHGFDVLLIYRALPRHLRRRLAIVMHRWVLTDALEPRAGSRLRDRLLVGLGFHAIVPLFFPVVLSAQYTRSRDALMEGCRLIDRGYSLIGFEGPGLAIAARQCGVPVVPVRVGNAQRADFRLLAGRVDASIHFEQPIQPGPGTTDADAARVLDEFYGRTERERGYD
jgi:long-chain acyl-CoA synthetase